MTDLSKPGLTKLREELGMAVQNAKRNELPAMSVGVGVLEFWAKLANGDGDTHVELTREERILIDATLRRFALRFDSQVMPPNVWAKREELRDSIIEKLDAANLAYYRPPVVTGVGSTPVVTGVSSLTLGEPAVEQQKRAWGGSWTYRCTDPNCTFKGSMPAGALMRCPNCSAPVVPVPFECVGIGAPNCCCISCNSNRTIAEKENRDDGLEARNILGAALIALDGSHSSSLVDCAKRAVELLTIMMAPATFAGGEIRFTSLDGTKYVRTIDGTGRVSIEMPGTTDKDVADRIATAENSAMVEKNDDLGRLCAANTELATVLVEVDDHIATIADEAFGPFPVQTREENLSAIELGIFGLRMRIQALETPAMRALEERLLHDAYQRIAQDLQEPELARAIAGREMFRMERDTARADLADLKAVREPTMAIGEIDKLAKELDEAHELKHDWRAKAEKAQADLDQVNRDRVAIQEELAAVNATLEAIRLCVAIEPAAGGHTRADTVAIVRGVVEAKERLKEQVAIMKAELDKARNESGASLAAGNIMERRMRDAESSTAASSDEIRRISKTARTVSALLATQWEENAMLGRYIYNAVSLAEDGWAMALGGDGEWPCTADLNLLKGVAVKAMAQGLVYAIASAKKIPPHIILNQAEPTPSDLLAKRIELRMAGPRVPVDALFPDADIRQHFNDVIEDVSRLTSALDTMFPETSPADGGSIDRAIAYLERLKAARDRACEIATTYGDVDLDEVNACRKAPLE